MPDSSLRVLFVGLADSRISYYRCVLPAMYLGCDWAGLAGTPPHLKFLTGYVDGETKLPRFEEYHVIVVQQPRGRGWLTLIRQLQSKGVVVLAEIDDYVHGIRKTADHDFGAMFTKEDVRQMEMCMRAADGIICSTDYIARRYRSINKTYLCENGLDMGRYRLTLPPRPKVDDKETVTIMWSGATGHTAGVAPWVRAIDLLLGKYPHVCFASIGQDFGSRLAHHQGRSISIPFAALETYPAAMTIGDIALAPAAKTSWYAGKSDLRAMEAAALGMPIVADPHYQKSVSEGETGFIVQSAGEAKARLEELILDKDLRLEMGACARERARHEFDMKVRRESWREAILDAYHHHERLAA